MTSPTSSPAAGRLILAASFSGPGGSLALQHADWREEIDWEKKATSSELATIKLGELLARRNLALADLTHVIVNVGPGSFTGIRVGLNLARTLAFALDRPLAGVDALTALANRHLRREGDSALVALRAVQTFYYAAKFTRRARTLDVDLSPRSIDQAGLDQAGLDHGGATEVLIEGVTPDFDPHVRARDLLAVLENLPDAVQFFSWREINPLYVRGSEAEEKLKKGLLKPL